MSNPLLCHYPMLRILTILFIVHLILETSIGIFSILFVYFFHFINGCQKYHPQKFNTSLEFSLVLLLNINTDA